MEKKHVIACLVENNFGVLARVSGLFSSRGFNINSLTVGETDDPTVSRMTIVVIGDDRIMDQVKKQLNKLVDVIKVMDLSSQDYIDRELALVKIPLSKDTRHHVLQILDAFGATIADMTQQSVTAEVTGDTRRIASFIDVAKSFGISEMARTGKIALSGDPITADK